MQISIRKNVNNQSGECIMDEHTVSPNSERNIDPVCRASENPVSTPCMLTPPSDWIRFLYAIWQFNRVWHDFPRLPVIHGARIGIRKDKEDQ